VSRRDWIKVRSDWWTSLSHADLSGDALAFGVGLMWLADSDPHWQETGSARLVDANGAPLTVHKIGARLRQDRRKCQRMLGELVATCTLVFDADSGCYSFPNYREHQESRDAKYKRQRRESVDNKRTVPVLSTTEAEAEAEADLTPPTPRKRGTATTVMASIADTEQVCDWIAEARRGAGIAKATPPGVTEQTRREVRKPMAKCGASVNDWRKVIARQAASCSGDIDAARKYLTLSTLHRPANFARLLERDDLDSTASAKGWWEA